MNATELDTSKWLIFTSIKRLKSELEPMMGETGFKPDVLGPPQGAHFSWTPLTSRSPLPGRLGKGLAAPAAPGMGCARGRVPGCHSLAYCSPRPLLHLLFAPQPRQNRRPALAPAPGPGGGRAAGLAGPEAPVPAPPSPAFLQPADSVPVCSKSTAPYAQQHLIE